MKKKRRRREDTEKWLWEEFRQIKARGEPMGPTAFAKRFGIHRTYLYTFTSLVAEISEYGRATQPSVSRRGAGVTATEARKREIDSKVRREHTQLSEQVEELRRRLEDAETEITSIAADKQLLSGKYDRLRMVFEYLLLLAVEAGVSPLEIEKIQEQVAVAADSEELLSTGG